MGKPPSTLRQRLRAAAAEEILDSAERAMVKHGYERATMQQLASEAGCATGTFYLYFRNKELLFQAIVARRTEAMFKSARTAMDSAADPLEKVRLGYLALLRYAFAHRAFFKLFFLAMPMRYRAMNEKLDGTTRQHRDEYDRLELAALREAQQKGRIRADLPAEVLQDFIDAVSITMVEQFLVAPGKQSAEDQMQILWDLVAGGIGAGNDHA